MEFQDYRHLGFTTLQNGLIAYYPKLNISDPGFITLIQLEAFSQKGEDFPTNEKIAANTNMTANQVASVIQQLINQDFITIDQTQDGQGKIGNKYNLAPLYRKLDKVLEKEIVPQATTSSQYIGSSTYLENNPLNSLTRKFEIEFGRYLSPIEREEIAAWLNVDHYSDKIIELALREAVLSQVYNLKYVDRILLNWQRRNLKTVEEIQTYLQRNK